MTQVLHVAVGLIRNEAGETLIARRPDHVHGGGLWEFPGGKVEAGETVFEALQRELREELGIQVIEASPQLKIRHDYPERSVLLDVWRVTRYEGMAGGAEQQPIRWVQPEDLLNFQFPAANRPIVNAARLPAYCAILDLGEASTQDCLDRLQRIIDGGFRLIQLRAPSLGRSAFRALAEQAVHISRAARVELLLNGDPALALELDAAGVHLSSRLLRTMSQRPLGESQWFSCACHDLEELRLAQRLGADFVLVSPVLPTPSHPGKTAIGWDGLQTLAEQAGIPVFALGGMCLSHVGQATQAGAQGIAGISAFLDRAEAPLI